METTIEQVTQHIKAGSFSKIAHVAGIELLKDSEGNNIAHIAVEHSRLRALAEQLGREQFHKLCRDTNKAGKTPIQISLTSSLIEKLPFEYLSLADYQDKNSYGNTILHCLLGKYSLHTLIDWEEPVATYGNGKPAEIKVRLAKLPRAWLASLMLIQNNNGYNLLARAMSFHAGGWCSYVPKSLITRELLEARNQWGEPLLLIARRTFGVQSLLGYNYSHEELEDLRLVDWYNEARKDANLSLYDRNASPKCQVRVEKQLQQLEILTPFSDLSSERLGAVIAALEEDTLVPYQAGKYLKPLSVLPMSIYSQNQLMVDIIAGKVNWSEWKQLPILVPCPNDLPEYLQIIYQNGWLDINLLPRISGFNSFYQNRKLLIKSLRELAAKCPRSFNSAVLAFCPPWYQWEALFPQIAETLHPVIRLHSPQGFSQAEFFPIFKLVLEDCIRNRKLLSSAIGIAYRLTVLYGNHNEVSKALRRASKCTLTLGEVSLPERGHWTVGKWRQLILHNFQACKPYIAKAPEIEQTLGHPPGKKEELFSINEKSYKQAIENPGLAELFKSLGLDNRHFLKGLDLLKHVKTSELCPDLQFEHDFSGRKHVFSRLKPSDPLGLVLGKFTSCCQNIFDNGEHYVKLGITEPDTAVYVLHSEQGDLVGQSFAWRTKDVLVFDSWESSASTSEKQCQDLLSRAAELALQLDPSLQAVHLGTGGGTPKLQIPFSQSVQFRIPFRLEQGIANDSQIQYVLASRKSCATAQPVLECLTPDDEGNNKLHKLCRSTGLTDPAFPADLITQCTFTTPNAKGNTPLHIAVIRALKQKDLASLKILAQFDAQAAQVRNIRNISPLVCAACLGQLDLVPSHWLTEDALFSIVQLNRIRPTTLLAEILRRKPEQLPVKFRQERVFTHPLLESENIESPVAYLKRPILEEWFGAKAAKRIILKTIDSMNIELGAQNGYLSYYPEKVLRTKALSNSNTFNSKYTPLQLAIDSGWAKELPAWMLLPAVVRGKNLPKPPVWGEPDQEGKTILHQHFEGRALLTQAQLDEMPEEAFLVEDNQHQTPIELAAQVGRLNTIARKLNVNQLLLTKSWEEPLLLKLCKTVPLYGHPNVLPDAKLHQQHEIPLSVLKQCFAEKGEYIERFFREITLDGLWHLIPKEAISNSLLHRTSRWPNVLCRAFDYNRLKNIPWLSRKMFRNITRCVKGDLRVDDLYNVPHFALRGLLLTRVDSAYTGLCSKLEILCSEEYGSYYGWLRLVGFSETARSCFTTKGETVWHLAARRGHLAYIKTTTVADLTVKSSTAETPIQIALRSQTPVRFFYTLGQRF